MKRIASTFGIAALTALVLAFSAACSLEPTPSDLANQTAAASKGVQNWSLWEPFDSFNTSVWKKSTWTNGGMFNCGFLADHVSVSGSQAVLKLDNVYSSGKSYSSGEIQSVNTFAYGDFEVNMMAVKRAGTVSSFFTYTGSPWDEIDVEILGKDTTKVQFNYFVNGVGGHEKVVDLGFDASYGFHKYRIEWGNGYINWYIDGVWKHGVNNTGFNAPYGAAMPSHPMQIMVNLWNGIGVDAWLNAFYYPGYAMYAKYDYIKYTPK